MTNRFKIAIVISVMCFVLLGAATVVISSYYTSKVIEKSNTVTIANGTSNTTVKNVSAITDEKLSVADVAKKVGPAIVSIYVESVGSDFFGRPVSSTGSGSGIIIAENGYILTNNHVIDGASTVRVRLSDGKEYNASLVGTDSATDLAVLKIEANGLPYAVLGDSSKLSVGDTAVALGNPLGELSGTVTKGIISATDREIKVGNGSMNLLQTDATVNPGNSGGALCNEYGEVVGVVNSKVSATGIEGLGFAIPINDAKPVIKKIIEKGPVKNAQDAQSDLYREVA